MNKLTDKELKELAKILEAFENTFEDDQAEVFEPNYAQADMFNYDDDYIDIEVTFADDAYPEQFKLERELLLKKCPLKEKVEAID